MKSKHIFIFVLIFLFIVLFISGIIAASVRFAGTGFFSGEVDKKTNKDLNKLSEKSIIVINQALSSKNTIIDAKGKVKWFNDAIGIPKGSYTANLTTPGHKYLDIINDIPGDNTVLENIDSKLITIDISDSIITYNFEVIGSDKINNNIRKTITLTGNIGTQGMLITSAVYVNGIQTINWNLTI